MLFIELYISRKFRATRRYTFRSLKTRDLWLSTGWLRQREGGTNGYCERKLIVALRWQDDTSFSTAVHCSLGHYSLSSHAEEMTLHHSTLNCEDPLSTVHSLRLIKCTPILLMVFVGTNSCAPSILTRTINNRWTIKRTTEAMQYRQNDAQFIKWKCPLRSQDINC